VSNHCGVRLDLVAIITISSIFNQSINQSINIPFLGVDFGEQFVSSSSSCAKRSSTNPDPAFQKGRGAIATMAFVHFPISPPSFPQFFLVRPRPSFLAPIDDEEKAKGYSLWQWAPTPRKGHLQCIWKLGARCSLGYKRMHVHKKKSRWTGHGHQRLLLGE
jgi:hypothetical protein